MKTNTYINKWNSLFLMFLISAGVQSCKEDEKQEANAPQTLISYEKVTNTTAQQIQLAFSLLTVAYPEVSNLNFSNIYDVDIYKVKYKTKLSTEDINASGLVYVPRTTEKLPILSFQNGTNTLHSNAPSVNINDDQLVVLQNVSGLGYIVCVPDYIGFGESSQKLHPYYHRQSNDAAVIDLLKASQELLQKETTNATPDGRLFMLGYSQGGWATLSAFKTLEENNTTTLNPIAASCGAGAYDLMEVANNILTRPTYGSPVYLPYFIESHQRNGLLDTQLDLYFNAPYASAIPSLFDGKHNFGNINSALNDTITRLMTPAMIANFNEGAEFEPLRNELSENSVNAWQVKGKLLFVHGTNDSTVPVTETQNIVDDFRQSGLSEEQVRMILLTGANHSSGILPWVIKSIVWLDTMK